MAAERSLGATLREYRLRAGLTQQAAAEAAGVSVRTLRELEQDRAGKPRRRSVAALAGALRVPAGRWEPFVTAPGAAPLLVGVLGPLLVRRGEVEVTPAGTLPRRLLALLASQPGEQVGRDRIEALLWPGTPPASSRSLIHSAVSAVRRALEPGRPAGQSRLLVRSGDGYRLVLAEDELDLTLFRAGVAGARAELAAGDPAAAAERLRSALELWRGAAGAGCDLPVMAGPAAERLEAGLLFADTLAGLGAHHQAVTALQQLARAEPLHEGVHARLIRALAASGAQAAALSCYDDLRRRLAAELGVDPTPELRAAHQEVLLGRPAEPEPPVPAQLPPAGAYFAGRDPELARLDAAAGLLHGGGVAVVISAVTGTAGIGKTALALHWAHRQAARFADGQLYLNLRGFDPAGPVEPAEALATLLQALRVTPDRIPAGVAERSGLLRSTLTGRSMLVVLDNARDADQVRPLLPGSAGCLTLVTSRNRMTGLVVTDGVVPVPLDLLSAAEARDLLARRLGAARIAAEPVAVREIVEMCANLPLALSVVAARAATGPRLRLKDLAAELAGARLDALDGGDPASDVRAVLSWSVRALSEPARRLLRLLAVHPGPGISLAAAASIGGVPVDQVRVTLDELLRASLLELAGTDRYELHDLLREYAAEQLGEKERRAAFRRLVDYFTQAADAADARLYPGRRALDPPAPVDGVTVPALPDLPAADAWFAAELPALIRLLTAATDAGLPAHVWHLTWTTFIAAFRGHEAVAQVGIQLTGVRAARQLGDRRREAISHLDLANALDQAKRGDEARTHLDLAQRLAAETGDGYVAGRAHQKLSSMLSRTQDPAGGLIHAEQALLAYRSIGDRMGEALAFNLVAICAGAVGDHDRAVTAGDAALRIAEDDGDRNIAAAVLYGLGRTYTEIGRPGTAVAFLDRALTAMTELHNTMGAVEVLGRMADAEAARGDVAAARLALDRAIELAAGPDPERAAELREARAAYNEA